MCRTCPENAAANDLRTNCSCRIGYYAVPSVNIFRTVDYLGYEAYQSTYILSEAPPEFDPNLELEWWCAACPVSVLLVAVAVVPPMVVVVV